MPRLSLILRRQREAKGWSQEELAARVKVTQGFIAQLEAGDKSPSLALLRRLAKALGVPVAELLK
jgi:transcriptional regulator with XRE-family HTH domain